MDECRFSRNRVELLLDGPAVMDAMLEAIGQARGHVHLEMYIYRDVDHGGMGGRFAQALREKAAQGVEVCLLYDPAGSRHAPHGFFRGLREQGVRVLEYNPVNPLRARLGWRPNRRDHRKLLIVDGRSAILGGTDISDHYARPSYERLAHGEIAPDKGGWHDVDVRIEGPAAATLQHIFLETWRRQGGEALSGPYLPAPGPRGRCRLRIAAAHPGAPDNAVHQAYLDALRRARSSVHIANAYFMPDRATEAALCAASRRGVAVTLLLPGVSDFTMLVCGQHAYYDRLLEAGVRIFELQRRLLHAKVAVVDERWCTVGSANLDMRSLAHAEEVNALMLDRDIARRLRAMIEDDIAQAHRILPEAWRARPWTRRLLQGLVYRFGGLL